MPPLTGHRAQKRRLPTTGLTSDVYADRSFWRVLAHISWHSFCFIFWCTEYEGRDTPGGRMRMAVRYAVLLTAVVLFSSIDAVAQQSPGMIATAAGLPSIDRWNDAARPIPETPVRRIVNVPNELAPDEAPPSFGVDEQPGSEAEQEFDGDSQAANDEDSFLLAVLHRGFWAMPPGGFTRILIQPPVPINPDSTVAAP